MHNGHGCTPGRTGSRSPVRYTSPTTWKLPFMAPVTQFAVPDTEAPTRSTKHLLVGGDDGFGPGIGGPTRQPGAVQVRLLPVSIAVAGPSARLPVPGSQLVTFTSEVAMSGTSCGSGKLLKPPPK